MLHLQLFLKLEQSALPLFYIEHDHILYAKYTFDRDKLGVFIQDQWESSKTYTVDEGTLPVNITRGYYDKINQFFNPNMDGHLLYEEFEPEILLDDHLVVITFCDKVLGVFATEYDFEKLINEINNE